MSKLERIDSVESRVKSKQEVLSRLPELKRLTYHRTPATEYFLRYCPDTFWKLPSSSTGKHHPPDERGIYGTLLHSKRVFVQYEVISEVLLNTDVITAQQRDAGLVAALTHDTFNYGWPSESREYTDEEHDHIASNILRKVDDMPQETIDLVESHLGEYHSEKATPPSTMNQYFFAAADRVAAQPYHLPPIHGGHDDLLDQLPHLTIIDRDKTDYGEEFNFQPKDLSSSNT